MHVARLGGDKEKRKKGSADIDDESSSDEDQPPAVLQKRKVRAFYLIAYVYSLYLHCNSYVNDDIFRALKEGLQFLRLRRLKNKTTPISTEICRLQIPKLLLKSTAIQRKRNQKRRNPKLKK